MAATPAELATAITSNVNVVAAQMVIGVCVSRGGARAALGDIAMLCEAYGEGIMQADVFCAVAHMFSVEDAMLLLDHFRPVQGGGLIIMAAVQNLTEFVARLVAYSDWSKVLNSAAQALIRAAECGSLETVDMLLRYTTASGESINRFVRVLALRYARKNLRHAIVELFDADALTCEALAAITANEFAHSTLADLLQEMYDQRAPDDAPLPDTAPMA